MLFPFLVSKFGGILRTNSYFFFRSFECLRGPIAIGWHPLTYSIQPALSTGQHLLNNNLSNYRNYQMWIVLRSICWVKNKLINNASSLLWRINQTK